MLIGQSVVEEEGSSARATTVTRTVYDEQGEVIHDETWNTSYRGEFRIIRVGSKPKPKPKPEKPAKPKPAPPPEPPPTTTTPTTPTRP